MNGKTRDGSIEWRDYAAKKNARGDFQLNDILTDPRGVSFKDRIKGTHTLYLTDRRGAEFSSEGTFIGFVEFFKTGGRFQIGISSDLDYEELIAKIYWNETYTVAKILQENGPDQLQLIINKPGALGVWILPLAQFMDALIFGKEELLAGKEIPSNVHHPILLRQREDDKDLIFFEDHMIARVISGSKSEITFYPPEKGNLILPYDLFFNTIRHIMLRY